MCTPLNRIRETIVLDLFNALKVHEDVWADQSAGGLLDPVRPHAAPRTSGLSKTSALTSLHFTSTSPRVQRRVRAEQRGNGRSLKSNGRRRKTWRWQRSASSGSSRSIWRRGDDVPTNFRGICYCTYPALCTTVLTSVSDGCLRVVVR